MVRPETKLVAPAARAWSSGWAAVAVALSGCVGAIGGQETAASGPLDPGAPGMEGAPPTGRTPGTGGMPATGGTGGTGGSVGSSARVAASRLRRLTQAEYNNTVRDLLGDTSAPASRFAHDDQPERPIPFASNSTSPVTETHGRDYIIAARDLAARAPQYLSAVLPCDPAKIGRAACARQFIAGFGLRAFRRPLTEGQITSLVNLQAAEADWADGVAAVVEALLQSPFFMFQIEEAAAGPKDKAFPVSGHELAARMSYFLWDSMPDQELFDAARMNKLGTTAEVEAQARRMLFGPSAAKATGAIRSFYEQLLDFEEFDAKAKDLSKFPTWPELKPLMREESMLFIDSLYQQKETLGTLLAAPFSIINQALASLYGTAPVMGTGFQKVSYDAKAPRAGVLTHASLMATKAAGTDTDPIRRGALLANHVLCLDIRLPPGQQIDPPVQQASLTRRQELEMHRRLDTSCAACHMIIDPLGFGFENYDALGKYRTTDPAANQPIDASGDLAGTDINGPFNGAVELVQRMARSKVAAECMALQWTRLAAGRETNEDGALKDVQSRFAASGNNLSELLVIVASSEIMRHRAGGQP